MITAGCSMLKMALPCGYKRSVTSNMNKLDVKREKPL